MDVSTIGSLASELSMARTGDAVSITVLKKAMDMQQDMAQQLIAALPPVPTNNPAHLGQSVNIQV